MLSWKNCTEHNVVFDVFVFLIKILVLGILSDVTMKCLCLSGWFSERWDNMHHLYSQFPFSFATQEEHCKRKWWVKYRWVVKNLWREGLHKHWLHMIRDCCNLWLCGELIINHHKMKILLTHTGIWTAEVFSTDSWVIHDADTVTVNHFRYYPKTRRKKYFLGWLESQGTVVFIEVPATEMLYLLFFIVSEGIAQNSVFMFESSLSFKFKPAVPWGWNMAMFWQQRRLPYVAVIKKLHWCQSLKSVF